jgi:CBS domain-containing protein
MERMKAKDIMSTPVVVVRLTDPIPDVIRTLRRHAISGVPVVDGFGLMVGIISEDDIVQKEAGFGGLDGGYNAEDVMTMDVVTASEETLANDIARLMVRYQINRVPIVRGEDLAGIVSRADILALLARSPAGLVAGVRAALRGGLLMDPDRLDVVVVNGDVKLRGTVADERDISLIRSLVEHVDGVSRVDVSGLDADPNIDARHGGARVG